MSMFLLIFIKLKNNLLGRRGVYNNILKPSASLVFENNFFNLLVLLFALIAVQYDFVISKKNMFTHDAIRWYGGMFFYYDSILNNYFPFWNPYSHAGEPYYITPHVNNALAFLTLLILMVAKLIKLSLVDLYHYSSFVYLYIFGVGSYYFYRNVVLIGKKNNGFCALLASVAVVLGLTSTTYRQPAFVFIACLAPWYTAFFIKMLKNFENYDVIKAKRYSFYFIIVFGMAMFTHIPTYSVFYISMLFLTLIIFRYISLKKFITHLILIVKDNWLYFLVIIIGMLLIVSPSIFLYFDFSGSDILHESRIMQRGLTEKINSYKEISGAYSNYFDFLQLFYPLYFHIFFVFGEQYASEATQYIGIIPIFFTIVTVCSELRKNKLVRSLFVVLIILGGIMLGKHFFFYYITFHIFPLFKTIIEMHQFLGFYIFILGSLVAVGCYEVINHIYSPKPCLKLTIMTVSYMAISIAIVYILNYLHFPKQSIPTHLAKYVDATCYPWLTFSSIKITTPFLLMCIVALFLFTHTSLFKSQLYFYLILFFLILVDLYIYNTKHLIPPLEYRTHTAFRTYLVGNCKTKNQFEYWRKPSLGFAFHPFSDNTPLLLKTRTLFSKFGSHLIMPKRYYELFVSVPIENQKIISGISRPVLRFYSKAYITDKPETILGLIASQPTEVLNNLLFLENNNIPSTARKLLVEDDMINNCTKSSKNINEFNDPIFRMNFYNKQLCIYNINEQQDFLEFIKTTPLIIDNYGMFLINNTWRGEISPVNIHIDGFEFFEGITIDNNKIIPNSNSKIISDFFYYDRDFNEYEKIKKNIKIIDFKPNKLKLEVITNEDGFLYYSDGWHKYWQAFVDDKQVPVLRANYNYKAVFLEKGSHTVCFCFNPKWYKYSLYLSLLLINSFVVFNFFLIVGKTFSCYIKKIF